MIDGDSPTHIVVAESRWWELRYCVSVCVSTRERNQFPSVRLHPPSLAREFIASYGEMSRRSGSAAEADNHSDISPSLKSITCERSPLIIAHAVSNPTRSAISLRFNGFACVAPIGDTNCVRPNNLVRSLTAIATRGGIDDQTSAPAGPLDGGVIPQEFACGMRGRLQRWVLEPLWRPRGWFSIRFQSGIR